MKKVKEMPKPTMTIVEITVCMSKTGCATTN